MDYLMYATDDDWACMGKGSFGCGAMGAMTTGKLKFKGPKMEAMKVMGPFKLPSSDRQGRRRHLVLPQVVTPT